MKSKAPLLMLLLAACAGPKPELAPGTTVAVPAGWREGAAREVSVAPRWWLQFNDEALNAMVEHAVRNNVDILQAGAKIEEARAQFQLARSRSLPDLSGSGSGGTNRSINAFGQGLDQTQVSGQMAIGYEVDLFGRLSAATDAERQALRASYFARDAMRVSLISAVVSGYIGLRGLDARLELVNETLQSRSEELAVIRRRAEAGYAAALDLRQAESAYEAAARLIPATRLAITQHENALSILVGDVPGSVPRGLSLGQLSTLDIPYALPSQVLRQRPDIAEAEARLVSTDRSLDAARAAFMPRLQLSASGGVAGSTALINPVTLFSLGGSVLAPLFKGGALRADAKAASARRNQAAFGYRRAVLGAFQEVENAMAGVVRLREEQQATERQVAAVSGALATARRRYRAGYASYLDQLDSERSLLEIKLQQVELQTDRSTNIVSLYQALGGGW